MILCHFSKVDNFVNSYFPPLTIKTFQNGSILRRNTKLLLEQILSFNNCPSFGKVSNSNQPNIF